MKLRLLCPPHTSEMVLGTCPGLSHNHCGSRGPFINFTEEAMEALRCKGLGKGHSGGGAEPRTEPQKRPVEDSPYQGAERAFGSPCPAPCTFNGGESTGPNKATHWGFRHDGHLKLFPHIDSKWASLLTPHSSQAFLAYLGLRSHLPYFQTSSNPPKNTFFFKEVKINKQIT